MNKILICILSVISTISCIKEENKLIPFDGNYTFNYVSSQVGFPEEKSSIVGDFMSSVNEFNRISALYPRELSAQEISDLKNIRDRVTKPDDKSLIQKVIPLEDLTVYLDNVYGGTVGGFISKSADVKALRNLYDVIYGLRLDYEGTKFSVGGEGYGVIRFFCEQADELIIPYCSAFGGITQGEEPFSGTGFTSSILGSGGFPEYKFLEYKTPYVGSEIYVVNREGVETLKGIFKDGAWTQGPFFTESKSNIINTKSFRLGLYAQYEGEVYEYYPINKEKCQLVSDYPTDGFEQSIYSGRYVKSVKIREIEKLNGVQSFATYNGYRFRIIGEDSNVYIAVCEEKPLGLDYEVYERGVYKVYIPKFKSLSIEEDIVKIK